MSRRRFPVLMLMISLASSLLGGVTPGWAAEKPVIEPRAERVLRATLEQLQATPEFTFRADVSEDRYLPSGQMIQFGRSLDMFVRRPNRILLKMLGHEGERSNSYFDGKKFTVYNAAPNSYAVWDAPPSIDEFNDKVRAALGFAPPLFILLHEDLAEFTMKRVVSGFYVGLDPVDGVLCHHVAVTENDIDYQIWIEEAKQLTIRKLVVTYKKQSCAPQYTVHFSHWDFKPGLVDFLFSFDPPEGAIKVDFLPTGKQ